MTLEAQIEELRQKIAEYEQRLRDIDAAAEGRSLGETEQSDWDSTLSELNQRREDLKKLQERHQEINRLADTPGHTESGDGARGGPEHMQRVQPFDGTDVRSLSTRQAQDRAQKLMENRDVSRHLSTRQADHLQTTMRSRSRNIDGAWVARRMLLTESEAYRAAFQKCVTQTQPVLTPEESRAVQAFEEFRAMNIGTDTAGGFGIPVVIDPTIILTEQGHPNPFLDMARVETITTDAWRGVNSAGVTWSFDGEATEVSDDSPTLAQPVVTAHKAQGFIPYSIEVGQDYPGFADEMQMLLAEGYNELLVEKLTTGSGSGEPTGIVTVLDANTSSEVAVTSSGSFQAADVYKVWEQLPIRYRARTPMWLSGTDAQNEVRQLGTDDGHEFTVNMTQEELPRLFGAPYRISEYFPAFDASTAGANLLVVGDFSNYVVAQRAGMSVELVPQLFGTNNNRPTGQRGWYAWARVGGNSVNDNAFRLLQAA